MRITPLWFSALILVMGSAWFGLETELHQKLILNCAMGGVWLSLHRE